MQPVCADLQGQILACYRENVGKTLNCSNIAALYLQCVNDAKQVRIYQTKSYSFFYFAFFLCGHDILASLVLGILFIFCAY